jgi:phage replication O-like protein O
VASPQTEDGYTRIANELLDALRLARLTATEFAVVLLVIRESYGWNRKATLPMGLKMISKKTGISRSSVQHSTESLLQKRLLKRAVADAGSIWMINKNWSEWGDGLTVPPGTAGQSPKGTAPQSPGGRPDSPLLRTYKVLKTYLKTRKTDGFASRRKDGRTKCAKTDCGIYAERGHTLCQFHETTAAAA